MGDGGGGVAPGSFKASGVGDSKLELGRLRRERLGRDSSPSAHSRPATGRLGCKNPSDLPK